MRPLPSDPLFATVWRRFQLCVHPDLFAQFPELQAANSASLQKLQGILNEARTAERATEEMQRPRTEVVELFLRDTTADAPADAPPAFLRVPLTIRLQGANSHHVLADAMATLFRHARLPTRFRWGDGFWGSSYKDGTEPEDNSEGAQQQRQQQQQQQQEDRPLSHDEWEAFGRRRR